MRTTTPVCRDSPTTSSDLRYSGRISSIPEGLAQWSFLNTSVTLALMMNESNGESPVSASTRETMTAGLGRYLKKVWHQELHYLIMSPIEVSSSLPYCKQCWQSAAFLSVGGTRFVRIALRPTESPSPWPHQTLPRPEFLPLLPPGPQHIWHHGTCQLPQESHNPARPNRTFQLDSPTLTTGIYHQVGGLLPQHAQQILWPQLRAAASTIEVQNMFHLNSMSLASPGIWEKLSQRWKLNTSVTEGSTRHSQQTLNISLCMPSLSSFLFQRIQIKL
ncbi:hypothetical protein CHARACLAT_000295 [Characodon lateralis]|uniref:Uncharacterized protein n=1 Tax=Characodon lateralis TaxID=208331 RepID=A0ABU7CJA0_9TELE|nr:hypothetical protein [Characodon lateralis]